MWYSGGTSFARLQQVDRASQDTLTDGKVRCAGIMARSKLTCEEANQLNTGLRAGSYKEQRV